MIEYILGNYLVEKQKLTQAQFQSAIYAQNNVRVKLGLIAVSEGLMTKEQADEVNRMQAIMDKRFGDIAVEKGYLTDAQVGRLLALQGNAYLSFVQTLVDEGSLTLEDVQEALELFQKENGFTNTDIEVMKSDDVDKMVPLFLPTDDETYTELVGVAIRMMIRLVDSHVYIGKASFEENYAVETLASQAMEGDMNIITSLAGMGEALLALACPFAQEVFDTVDEDAIDAVGEFLNNTNGIFASALSQKDVTLELMPPEYSLNRTTVEGNVLVVPCYIGSSKIELIVKA